MYLSLSLNINDWMTKNRSEQKTDDAICFDEKAFKIVAKFVLMWEQVGSARNKGQPLAWGDAHMHEYCADSDGQSKFVDNLVP